MSDVFCLTDPNGKLLDPAIQATVLAKYSRSPMSAKEILAGITSEEADKFNDKWVIGYGHSSVAELATIPICIEGLSIIASKVVETVQRGAYSEKSTRYQRFSKESFVTPPGCSPTMKEFAGGLYVTYDKLHDPMVKRCAVLMGKDPTISDRVVNARAFDNLRYLLPAGTGTNVACVLNFRDARDLVSTLLGRSNPELKQLGEGILSAVSEVCPVLMRHAIPNMFEPRIKSLGIPNEQFDPTNPGWNVTMVGPPVYGGMDWTERNFEDLVKKCYGMDWASFSEHMDARPEHSEVPDLFKTVNITFDVMMDFGAFRDLQRHRRCEQLVEPLTTQYGYVVPDDILNSELESEYRLAMESVLSYTDEVVNDQDLSQYVIPLGYLHRSFFQMTLKELYYLVELRTRPQGHMSYRRVAYEIYELAKNRYPKLMKWCRACQPVFQGEHR